MGRLPECPENAASSPSRAVKALLEEDARFGSLLAAIPDDIDAAIDALAWEYEYFAWLTKLKKATKSLPAVPTLSRRGLAHLRRLRMEGMQSVGYLPLAYKRARVVSEEVALAQRVRLGSMPQRPKAWSKSGRLTMLGALVYREARKIGLMVEARHFTLIGVYSLLETKITSRKDWDLALDRWQHRLGTVGNLATQLDRLMPRKPIRNSR